MISFIVSHYMVWSFLAGEYDVVLHFEKSNLVVDKKFIFKVNLVDWAQMEYL